MHTDCLVRGILIGFIGSWMIGITVLWILYEIVKRQDDEEEEETYDGY